jgi:hypothetical protein
LLPAGGVRGAAAPRTLGAGGDGPGMKGMA